MDNVNLLSPSVLAFVGDAVYGLMVRTRLAEINRSSGDLHALSVKYVSAVAQAEAFKVIEDLLNEKVDDLEDRMDDLIRQAKKA